MMPPDWRISGVPCLRTYNRRQIGGNFLAGQSEWRGSCGICLALWIDGRAGVRGEEGSSGNGGRAGRMRRVREGRRILESVAFGWSRAAFPRS